jgi:hypothetical protein
VANLRETFIFRSFLGLLVCLFVLFFSNKGIFWRTMRREFLVWNFPNLLGDEGSLEQKLEALRKRSEEIERASAKARLAVQKAEQAEEEQKRTSEAAGLGSEAAGPG